MQSPPYDSMSECVVKTPPETPAGMEENLEEDWVYKTVEALLEKVTEKDWAAEPLSGRIKMHKGSKSDDIPCTGYATQPPPRVPESDCPGSHGRVSTPVITTVLVNGTTQIAVVCETEGATIHYSTDGRTTPSRNSTRYTLPIPLSPTNAITVQAMATREDLKDSAVSRRQFMEDDDVPRLLHFKASIHQSYDLTSWSIANPIQHWRGITCENQRVSRIELPSMGATGAPDLDDLPSSLRELNLSNNRFTGTPNLCWLPPTLINLFLAGNEFFGAPHFGQLPPSLEILSLNNNHLSGILDLSGLPPSLNTLVLSNNRFTTLEISPNAPRDSLPEYTCLRGNSWVLHDPHVPRWIAELI
jgi:hypothetical protein